jgi:DNA-binding transcriptional LysR family regulator
LKIGCGDAGSLESPTKERSERDVALRTAILSMEIRELRYFVALAEELHFARAAARIGIEQSPLSKAITEMERRLGVRLFIRTRRSTTLTSIGETLLKDARAILAQLDLIRLNLSVAASGRSGCLRLAVCDGVAHARLARLLAHFRQDSPGVDIQIVQIPFSEQLRRIRSYHIDVGFGLCPSDDPQLRSTPLWVDRLVFLMRRDRQFADPRVTVGSSGGSLPLILLGEGLHPISEATSAHLKGLTGSDKAIQYVSSMELLQTLVSAGYGIGVIGASQAEGLLRPELVMCPLDVNESVITTFMVLRDEAEPALMSRLIAEARAIQ